MFVCLVLIFLRRFILYAKYQQIGKRPVFRNAYKKYPMAIISNLFTRFLFSLAYIAKDLKKRVIIVNRHSCFTFDQNSYPSNLKLLTLIFLLKILLSGILNSDILFVTYFQKTKEIQINKSFTMTPRKKDYPRYRVFL